ncbi:hypothetical protein Tco_0217701 [Tanacetum coccineum]
MDFRSFMIQGIDGEFNFLPKGGLDDSPSVKSVNNGIPVVAIESISTAHPSTFDENVICSADNISKADGKIKHVAGSQGEGSRQRTQKRTQEVPPRTKFPSANELRDATDSHWVVAHVTPPSWKQHLRDISLEQLCDIHDRAYMRQVVLDNVLNSRTRELISELHKARDSYDVIREREIKKDKAYVELVKKCNEALQDLDKNPLVFDMHSKIETLQGQIYSLRKKFKISETQLLQEIDSLKQDKAVVVTKVVPDAAMKLIQSDDMGILIAKLVKASMFHGRCAVFEEVANLKEPFVLEKMPGYRPSSKEEFDRAGDNLANASYPFFVELTVDPYAFVE